MEQTRTLAGKQIQRFRKILALEAKDRRRLKFNTEISKKLQIKKTNREKKC